MIKSRLAGAAALAILATGLTSGAAQADEVWSTAIGDVVYEDEIGAYTVLSYPTIDPEKRGLVFLQGLAGNYDNRSGQWNGYWVEENGKGDGACMVSIVDHTGVETDNWGRIKLYFTETGFPSAWVAVRGSCFDEPSDALAGLPVVAGPAEGE